MKKKRIIKKRQLLWLLPLAAALLFAVIWLFRPQSVPHENAALTLAAQDMPSYDIFLRMNEQEHTVSFTETVSLTNRTGEALDSVVVRTWLNAFASQDTSPATQDEIADVCYPDGFSEGTLTLFDVRWNGALCETRYVNADRTALEISVPAWQPGERAALEIRAVAALPQCAFCTGITEDWALGHVLPTVSVYESGVWHTEPYAPVGDPFLADCANYRLEMDLPDGVTPVCSAPMTKNASGTWTGEIMAARDIGLVLSRGLVCASGTQDGVAVSAWAKTRTGAQRALKDAQQALQTFASLYGAYPWPCYTVCSVDFPYSGMEYTAFSMLGESLFSDASADTLEIEIAHETAHQWFYALVGSDGYSQPWQDEALCTYAMLRYVKERYGAGSFDTLKYYRVDAPMQEHIPDLTPGMPIDRFSALQDYAAVVYGRGAALLLALDEMLPGGIDGFLSAYARQYAFSIASRTQFEQALCDYAQMDVRPLLTDYLDTIM